MVHLKFLLSHIHVGDDFFSGILELRRYHQEVKEEADYLSLELDTSMRIYADA